MKSLVNFFVSLMSNPFLTFALVAFTSFFALSAALFSEAFLGLEPCILCIYQRYPFTMGLALGLVGLGLTNNTKISRILFAITGIAFLINSGIAMYQTGVELRWWQSSLDACSVPIFMDAESPKSILENLMSAPMAACDEIQWVDPILGLTMANYNVLLCFGLFVFCLLAAYFVNSKKN